MPVCRVNVCLLLLFYSLFSSLLLFLSDFKDVYILHSVVILILLWQINIVVVVVMWTRSTFSKSRCPWTCPSGENGPDVCRRSWDEDQ